MSRISWLAEDMSASRGLVLKELDTTERRTPVNTIKTKDPIKVW